MNPMINCRARGKTVHRPSVPIEGVVVFLGIEGDITEGLGAYAYLVPDGGTVVTPVYLDGLEILGESIAQTI